MYESKDWDEEHGSLLVSCARKEREQLEQKSKGDSDVESEREWDQESESDGKDTW